MLIFESLPKIEDENDGEFVISAASNHTVIPSWLESRVDGAGRNWFDARVSSVLTMTVLGNPVRCDE